MTFYAVSGSLFVRLIDTPMLNQPVEDWRAHLKELAEIPVGAADILVLEGISYAQEVIREKEAGELPY